MTILDASLFGVNDKEILTLIQHLQREINKLKIDLGKNIPSGLIAMWKGALADIPEGWYICDGNNGTVNLLDKFVKSVPDASTDPGTTGGALSKTTAGHFHTQPTHTHNPGGLSGSLTGYGGTGWVSSGGTVSAPTGAGGNNNTGSRTDSIADIRPPYYELAFIMKG
jgi:hypothetical protein